VRVGFKSVPPDGCESLNAKPKFSDSAPSKCLQIAQYLSLTVPRYAFFDETGQDGSGTRRMLLTCIGDAARAYLGACAAPLTILSSNADRRCAAIERLNDLLRDPSRRGHCIVMYLCPAEYGLQLLLGMSEIEGLFDTSGFCIDSSGVDPLCTSDVLPENSFQTFSALAGLRSIT